MTIWHTVKEKVVHLILRPNHQLVVIYYAPGQDIYFHRVHWRITYTRNFPDVPKARSPLKGLEGSFEARAIVFSLLAEVPPRRALWRCRHEVCAYGVPAIRFMHPFIFVYHQINGLKDYHFKCVVQKTLSILPEHESLEYLFRCKSKQYKIPQAYAR